MRTNERLAIEFQRRCFNGAAPILQTISGSRESIDDLRELIDTAQIDGVVSRALAPHDMAHGPR